MSEQIEGLFRGRVKLYNRRKGFGVIVKTCEKDSGIKDEELYNPNEFFVQYNDIRVNPKIPTRNRYLKEGEYVHFNIEFRTHNMKSRWVATCVTGIDNGPLDYENMFFKRKDKVNFQKQQQQHQGPPTQGQQLNKQFLPPPPPTTGIHMRPPPPMGQGMMHQYSLPAFPPPMLQRQYTLPLQQRPMSWAYNYEEDGYNQGSQGKIDLSQQVQEVFSKIMENNEGQVNDNDDDTETKDDTVEDTVEDTSDLPAYTPAPI